MLSESTFIGSKSAYSDVRFHYPVGMTVPLEHHMLASAC
jgi:hypothetical protein